MDFDTFLHGVLYVLLVLTVNWNVWVDTTITWRPLLKVPKDPSEAEVTDIVTTSDSHLV